MFLSSKIFHPRRASSPRLSSSISRNVILDANRDLDLNSSINSDLEISETLPLPNSNMADLDGIYRALHLVPEFDGNPNILTRFIKLCDQLVAEYYVAGQNLTNYALLNGILNKVTGPAARLINANGIPENWQGIRNALINNFADQRDETSLYNDLALLTQGGKTPQEFYEQCQNLFSTIITYVTLHETVESTIQSKRDLYKKLTLQAFLRGLQDPLGYRIRCMRPDSIEKALEFVHEETNTLYLQRRNQEKSMHQPPRFSNNFMSQRTDRRPQPNPIFNTPGTFRQNTMNEPQRFPQAPNRSFHTQRFNQPTQGPSRTQQIFKALPRSNMSTGFRIPPRPQYNNYPRPMSGVSHPVARSLPQHNMDINLNDINYDYDYHNNYSNDSNYDLQNDYSNDYQNYYDENMYYPYDEQPDPYNSQENNFALENQFPIEDCTNSDLDNKNVNFSQDPKKNVQR